MATTTCDSEMTRIFAKKGLTRLMSVAAVFCAGAAVAFVIGAMIMEEKKGSFFLDPSGQPVQQPSSSPGRDLMRRNGRMDLGNLPLALQWHDHINEHWGNEHMVRGGLSAAYAQLGDRRDGLRDLFRLFPAGRMGELVGLLEGDLAGGQLDQNLLPVWRTLLEHANIANAPHLVAARRQAVVQQHIQQMAQQLAARQQRPWRNNILALRRNARSLGMGVLGGIAGAGMAVAHAIPGANVFRF